MTGIAKLTAGMLLGVDLGEALGLRNILGMTADAQMGNIGLLRRHACGIFSMFCKGAVAGFTVDVSVYAFGLRFGNVGMAVFAGLVAGVNDWPCADLGNGISAKMPIAAEALWDEHAAEYEEKNQPEGENHGQAK